MGTHIDQREAQRKIHIARYEALGRSHPRTIASRFAIMSFLGQLLAMLLVLGTAAGFAALVWIYWNLDPHNDWKGIWLGGAIAIGVVLLLLVFNAWVRIPAPDGLPIGRYDAPRLSEVIEQERLRTGGPPIHEILLTPEATAEIQGRPWLGLIGPRRNTLILGVPLLAGLSETQMCAIVAHEFAHIRASRLPIAVWLHRSLTIWGGENRPLFRLINGLFAPWYLPRLEALMLVARRHDECAADAAAAQLVGPQQAAQALLRTVVVQGFVNRDYWPQVLREARSSVSPPGRLVSGIAQRLRAGDADPKAARYISRALRDRTDPQDSHPALTDRLAAIGWPVGVVLAEAPVESLVPPRPERMAIETLFDATFVDQALAVLDHAWSHALASQWFQQHAEAERSRAELKQLCADQNWSWESLARDAEGNPLPPDDLPADAALRSRWAKLVASAHGGPRGATVVSPRARNRPAPCSGKIFSRTHFAAGGRRQRGSVRGEQPRS